MERRGLAPFLASLEKLVELGKENLLFLGEVRVEFDERLLHGLSHIVKFGVVAAMDAVHFLHQLHQLLVMLMEGAVVLLQHIVHKQV